jgi:small subunit ribosomal protein S21
MIKVTANSNESEAQLFRRFKAKVARSGVLADARKKRWHVPKSEVRRIEDKKAARRYRRKMREQNAQP